MKRLIYLSLTTLILLATLPSEAAIFKKKKRNRKAAAEQLATPATIRDTVYIEVPVPAANVPAETGHYLGDVATFKPEASPFFQSEDQTHEEFDSLVRRWQEYNNSVSFERYFKEFIDIDSTATTGGTTPDSVYAARLQAMLSPIQLPYNSIIKERIDRYVAYKDGVISRILGLSQYYFPIIEEILYREGLPLELKMLPVIESALQPAVRSRAGAVGLWQFIYPTAKNYGFEITSFVDQRCDPVVSTVIACRYLKDLYRIYKDWTLAIAAYNCGPGNVNKAMRRAGDKARTYWDIYHYLPTETRGYVPAFIAATYAYNYHKQHGIEITEPPMPLATDTVSVTRLTHLGQVAETIGVPMETLQLLNPQYTKDIIPAIDKSYSLVLPRADIGKYIELKEEIHAKDSIYLGQYLNPANLSKTKQAATSGYRIHKVRSGETLGAIARKYGTTVNNIMKWNNLRNADRLSIGQRLEIRN
ncbi:MAG: transglycosylase SLT domain-containing protein [Rikenellaceae bacterium]|nr:transglycosylase SLT domain-containing protein [Rikenellaceae bacterium]